MHYDERLPDYVVPCGNCGCPTDDGSCPECGAADPHRQAEVQEEKRHSASTAISDLLAEQADALAREDP